MTEPPCSDLLDINAVADLLRCTPASARTIIGRSAKTSHPFPSPCIVLGNSPGYSPDEVEWWIQHRPGAGRGPRPGRRQTDQQRLKSLAGGRDYLTAGRMAAFLNCTIEELSRKRGNAPRMTKAGGFLRFYLVDVEAWLAAREERKAG